MSLLWRSTEERATVRLPPGVGPSYEIAFGGGRGSTPVNVSVDSAMRHDAVWSCRTRIAEDVSMMPVDVVRYEGRRRRVVTPTPQIIAAPSVFDDDMDWRYSIIQSWTGHGNAWGLVTQTSTDGRYPTRIELKDQAMSVQVHQTGNKITFIVDGEEEDLWPVGRLWHSPAYKVPGRLLGLSPIQHHAMQIGKGMAAGMHGFQYFTDGAHPTSVWRLKGASGDDAKTFKERLMGLAYGNREPLTVNAEQVEMAKMQSDPSDSQFLETERYTVEQICRIYNCDPADHGSSSGGSSITYANRTDADLARLKRRQYWITKLERELTKMLPRPQVVKLNTSAFLRMTERERWEIHDLRLRNKTTSVNRVLTIEDEDPFGKEYDEPGIPGGPTDKPVSIKGVNA